MGNMMKRNPGGAPMNPQQGGMYAPYQQQPMVQQQPMMQPMMQQQQQQPVFAQQPPPQMMQQPAMGQQPNQYRPSLYPAPPQSYRPSYPSGPGMPRYPAPSATLGLPPGQTSGSYYENDAFLSNLTGWSVQDIERLRHEYQSYSNQYGVIDREGFRKLYIASLLNMTWEAIERDAEAAFRNFDINQTGTLDFNEYITACSRMTRETQQSYTQPPPANQSFDY